MSPPKLLIVTTVPETLATILKHQPAFLAKALNGSLEVELVTSPDPICRTIAQTEGVPVHRLRMVRGIAPLSDLRSLFAMVALLMKIKPAMVHSYTPKAGMITMLAAWLCRIPVRIHTFTGLVFPSHTGIKQALLIGIDRLICACANQVIPEGRGVKNDLQRFRITKKALDVIGNGNIAGVNTSHFNADATGLAQQSDALAREFGISKDDFVFCFVGRLNRDKGITELLAAFRDLPENARLLLVGTLDRTAPISRHDEDIIRRHPRIHALGFQADIRASLRLANILVLPSYREGFPNAVLQAGSMELPVIATDVNGSNEIIEPGINGWLVAARDADQLNQAMSAAMQSNPQELQRLGRQARTRVMQRFEQRQHQQRMANLYCSLLTSSEAEQAGKATL